MGKSDYAISLTSIPPRFDKLGPVLHSLLAQNPAPSQVYLCLPDRYCRFPAPARLPDLPTGVQLLNCPNDYGPATKALAAVTELAGQLDALIYCDDDWIMPPNWAATLLEAQQSNEAVTGAGFNVDRLGRQGAAPGFTDIAQGFAGVLIDPKWLSGPGLEPPADAWPVDDIWLSGHLARQGIPIRIAEAARKGMALAYDDAHGLQDHVCKGRSRDQANRACAALMHQNYGIWPERTQGK